MTPITHPGLRKPNLYMNKIIHPQGEGLNILSLPCSQQSSFLFPSCTFCPAFLCLGITLYSALESLLPHAPIAFVLVSIRVHSTSSLNSILGGPPVADTMPGFLLSAEGTHHDHTFHQQPLTISQNWNSCFSSLWPLLTKTLDVTSFSFISVMQRKKKNGHRKDLSVHYSLKAPGLIF